MLDEAFRCFHHCQTLNNEKTLPGHPNLYSWALHYSWAIGYFISHILRVMLLSKHPTIRLDPPSYGQSVNCLLVYTKPPWNNLLIHFQNMVKYVFVIKFSFMFIRLSSSFLFPFNIANYSKNFRCIKLPSAFDISKFSIGLKNLWSVSKKRLFYKEFVVIFLCDIIQSN